MAVAAIPLSTRGLTSQVDPTRLKTGDLIHAENVRFSLGNLLEKDGGSLTVTNSDLPSPVKQGIDWWPDSSNQSRVVALNNGDILKDKMTGNFGFTLTSVAPGDAVTFAEGGAEAAGRDKKLFIFSPNKIPQVVTGTADTAHDLATPHSDWGTAYPTAGMTYHTYMVAWGMENDPHRIYGSANTDHEVFEGDGSNWSILIYQNIGQKIVTGLNAYGKAWLWKYPLGIFWIEETAQTDLSLNWVAKIASSTYGVADSFKSIAYANDSGIAFITSAGSIVFMEEAYASLTGVTFKDLTKLLNQRTLMQENFNLNALHLAQLMWYDDKYQLHAILSSPGTTNQDRRLIMDFATEQVRTEITTNDTNTAIWPELDSNHIYRPMIGTSGGRVKRLDQDVRLVDGMPYQMVVQTAPTDFSDISEEYIGKKLFYRMHLEHVPTGSYTLPCEVFIDGVYKGRVNFIGAPTTVLPQTLPFILGSSEGLRKRFHDIIGEGYTISLKLTENSAHAPKLSRVWVEFDQQQLSR